MSLIAMTREMGSLGKDVAAQLAKRSGRRVVYHEIIDQVADKMRLRKSHVIRLLEGGAGLWERLTSDRTSLSIFTADETLRFVLDPETAVIRGWGAAHLLAPISHVVRVRVCAPRELRVQRMMQRLATDDRSAVEREIDLADEAHTAIVRRHFNIDWRQPEHYDLVLSTHRMSVDECVEEIERTMHLPRFQPTAESDNLVRTLALEWSIRASLRRDPRTASLRLQLECEAGLARARGWLAEDEAAAVLDVIQRVPGVSAAEIDLREMPPDDDVRADADRRRAAYLGGTPPQSSAA